MYRSASKMCAGLAVAALVPGMECMTATQPVDTPNNEPPKTVSFEKDVQPIFNEHCTGCHVTGGFANNSGIPLRLIDGVSYNLLYSRKSVQDPNFTLVKPGDSANSLLYLKITLDDPPVGSRMPLFGNTVVTPQQMETIKTWIDEGAANN